MFRIRKVRDTRAPANAAAIAEAQAIVRARFAGIPAADVDKLPDQIENPFRHRFVAKLFVAEDARERVRAIGLVLYDPDLAFAFLDVVAAAPSARAGSGIGGAIYDRVRLDALEHGARGLYFECLPDESEPGLSEQDRRQNARRLAFYERYGARPVVGTEYRASVNPGDVAMPFLMFDGLGRHDLPDAATLRKIVRAILERKYASLCPPEYVDKVAESIRDGQFGLRPPRYARAEPLRQPLPPAGRPMVLVVNEGHDIHHVRERGYVESPVRVSAILAELDKTPLFSRVSATRFPDRWIRAVHDVGLVNYIERACAEAPAGKSVYPYVFPIRNPQRRPKERSVLAGYWCIDTFTPLNRNVWPAARGAVDCALTAARAVLDGAPAAYALVRPPGHHAERRAFGGFCYFCNAAVAANYLSRYGRVAILDIDYHHGNGQQDIFYERSDVFTVSIHGDPSFAYPYFTGFRNETGRREGAGYNLNVPLAETITPEAYREALGAALRRIQRFSPDFLVLALGLDTARGDPTGTWSNRAGDFAAIGRMVGEAGFPTVVVQEGGYRIRTLGVNARHFFTGLADGHAKARRVLDRPDGPGRETARPRRLSWREAVRAEDGSRVRALVAATGMFSAEEVDIAEELVSERVEKGRASGYEFVLAYDDGALAGYACFGPVPGSEAAFDLYWIAVAPDRQGRGLGRRILARAEAAMARAGARQIHVDTSTHERYAATRAFYAGAGYALAAEFSDFYRPGDGKAVYVKRLKQ